MPVKDIRPFKTKMREQSKAWRRSLTAEEKQALDSRIAERLYATWQYRRCRTLLVYVSTAIEVDTHALIARALADGKRVAVPRCVPGTRDMEFYYITGEEELSPGTFGVPEPAPDPSRRLHDMRSGLCLVPALWYDWRGYRLGYGKGYYDRFLAGFSGTVMGIEYSHCVCRSLPHGRFDRRVELLVTDAYIRRTDPARAAVGTPERKCEQHV